MTARAPKPERTLAHRLEGLEWVARVEGDDWRTPAQHSKCRSRYCPNAPVMELNRRRYRPRTVDRIDSWWAYCADHGYGRWVEDGQVWHWVLRPSETTS